MTARCRAGWGLALGLVLATGQAAWTQATGEVANPPAYVRTINQANVYRGPSTVMQVGFLHMGARCKVLKAVRTGKTLWYQVRWEQGGVSFARDYNGAASSGSGYVQGSATDRPELPDAPAKPDPPKPNPKDQDRPLEKALPVSPLRPTATFGARYLVVEERYDPDARRYRWVLEATEDFRETPSFIGEFQDDAGEAVRKITLRFEPANGYMEKGARTRASLPYPSEVILSRVRRILVTKSRL